MIFDKLKDIIVEQLDADEDAVTLTANIQEDLGADSPKHTLFAYNLANLQFWYSVLKRYYYTVWSKKILYVVNNLVVLLLFGH